MDYEKKYKNALERAKQELSVSHINSDSERQLYRLFPELAESEDEKIRKALIRFHKSTIDIDGIEGKDILAWLEKQGKETSWKPSKEEMDVLYGLAYITNQYDEHKEEVITRLYQDLKREFFNGSSYENMFPTNTSTEDDVRRRSTIQVLEYARSLDAYNQYGKADIDKNIAWLDKQKVSTDIIKDKNVPISTISNETTEEMIKQMILLSLQKDIMATKNSGCSTTDLEKCVAWLEKQGVNTPAWGEEDNTIADNLAWAIANDKIRPQDRDDYCEWLKSLKQRLGGEK